MFFLFLEDHKEFGLKGLLRYSLLSSHDFLFDGIIVLNRKRIVEVKYDE